MRFSARRLDSGQYRLLALNISIMRIAVYWGKMRSLADGCDILERLWVNKLTHAHYLLDSFNMIKLRLKKFGKKREASYRIVAAQSTTRRDGRPLEELGFYNPRTDEVRLNTEAIVKRLQQGAQPTETVRRILEKAKVYEQLGT